MRLHGFVPVIGLEIHVQLATRTKLFCGDLAAFGGTPNSRVCPVCLGLPGALPVVNARAVGLAVRTALALHCRVHGASVFARKHYFYPDLPKGYQITQYDRPLATDGWLDIDDEAPHEGSATPQRVRIRRVHLEEDAGKSVHDRIPGRTAVDHNRAGVPLVEIVTEPDLTGPAHARRFLDTLKRLLRHLEVSDCDMEKGSLRVDANLSLRRPGGPAGEKTEVKNLNSFAGVERALTWEAERQAGILAGRGRVAPETLLWDDARGEARGRRSKEQAHDYRYLPEPDLPPLVLAPGEVDAARAALPEPPRARARRFRDGLGLPAYDAGVLTASRALADYFEAVAGALGDAKLASNWVMTEVLTWLNRSGGGVDALPVPPQGLAELIDMVRRGRLSRAMARDVFRRMADTGESADAIVAAEGLSQVSDPGALEACIDRVIARHPDEAARLRAGETRLMGFFMGRVMAATDGRADPRLAARLLRARLAR